MEKKQNSEIRFGMFGGVFTPSVLTIIGVILFLRTGWVIGNAGLYGALAIIVIAHTVTVATGLSLSSITTNIRIGAGGAYSIVARSLGLEVGGAIGIPLYLSQAVSAAFYIAGFTEGWVRLFPYHPPYIIALISWFVLTVVSYIGAHWALRVQYVIMAAIGISLISFFGGAYSHAAPPQAFGDFHDADFWKTFAIFFPAVTGIMAGVSMSGDLKDAKKAIPIGTMLAIGVGFVIYFGSAVALAYKADAQTLLSNSTIIYDVSLLHWTFYVGVFAATLSSALGSLVAAPRTLYALGEHGVIPLSGFFSKTSATGQPRNAVILTGAISVIFVIAGSLDSIAQLLTMFFLITYGMVCLVTFIEQAIGIVSFRPSLRVPLFVPLYGAISCLLIMLLISPISGFVAILVTTGIYFMLARSGLVARWGDVRGGLLSSIAGWAASRAIHLPRHDKSWTPDLLLPIEEPRNSTFIIRFARDISYPGGSVIAFTVTTQDRHEKLAELDSALMPIRRDKMFFISSAVDGSDLVDRARVIIQLVRETFFRPNVLLITLSADPAKDGKIYEIVESAIEENMGIAILKIHPTCGFGDRQDINIILRDRSPNKNLAILLGLQLHRNWDNAAIRLVSLAKDDRDRDVQEAFFKDLIEQARMPHATSINIVTGQFPDDLSKMPPCDIAVFGLGQHFSTEQIRQISACAGTSCLFIRDSGHESAFA